MESLTKEQTKKDIPYTSEERIEILHNACARYEREIRILSIRYRVLSDRFDKFKDSVKIVEQNPDKPIVATIKSVYQLEDYEYKDKVLTIYLMEFDEFIDKLYLHRTKGNMDGLLPGAKATFKVEGDKLKDFKPIKNIIT